MSKEKTKRKIDTEENKVVKRFIIVLVVVVLCVVAIYFITRAFVSKDLFNKKDNNEASEKVEFNYDITILGAAFNRPYSEYYILAYDETSEEAYNLSGYLTKYMQKEDHIKIYHADLADYMNKNFYDEENVNPNATKASELKVGKYTLIRFKDGKIVDFIEGVDNIKEELGVE